MPLSHAPSRTRIAPGDGATVLDALDARFPAVGRAVWQQRMARGLVLDEHGTALPPDAVLTHAQAVQYWREVPDEPAIAVTETVLHMDAHLVIADKPHGLPVTPAGPYVRETLLARLVEKLGNPQLVPLHRIDRDTAGLVMFSAMPETRARYQALFRERRIAKHYEAIAGALPKLAFPHARESRIGDGAEGTFPRMAEQPGAPNSRTSIEVIARGNTHWHYALAPETGRKHQLRLHMAGLGAPIVGDVLYGSPGPDGPPLQLLARALAFDDPLDGAPRRFESGLSLETATLCR